MPGSIDAGLSNSRFALACLSCDQTESDWRRMEWTNFHSSARVLPLILDDMPVGQLPEPLQQNRCYRYTDLADYQNLLDRLASESAPYAEGWVQGRPRVCTSALIELFWACFEGNETEREIRSFFHHNTRVKSIGRALPGGGSSLEAIIQAAVGQLQTHNLLVPFFEALDEARPGQRDLIAQVARTCGIDFDAPR